MSVFFFAYSISYLSTLNAKRHPAHVLPLNESKHLATYFGVQVGINLNHQGLLAIGHPQRIVRHSAQQVIGVGG